MSSTGNDTPDLPDIVDPLAAIEQAVDAIGFDDLDGNVVWGNPAFRRLFGLGDDEPLGRLEDYVAPGSHEALLRNHQQRYSGEALLSTYQFEAVRRDGSRLWAEASVVPIVRDDRIVGTYAVLRDVTSRREREAELDRAQAQYRTLFERAFDAILVFEPHDETVLDVNPRACELYGRSREELIGMSLLSITRDPGPGRDAVAQVDDRGMIRDFETVHLHRDGTELFIECSGSMIEYQGRRAVLSINRDVTERRRLQQRLNHAEKMEGVGRLAAGVAHEFNNVLAAVLGTAEALLDEVEQRSARELLEQMIARGHAGAEITRELLSLSRMPDAVTTSLSLDSSITTIAGWLGPLLGDRVRLELQCHAPGVLVMMDLGQLEQLLANLAINARDAMEGDGTLRIHTAALELAEPRQTRTHLLERGRYLRLSVQDSGPGVPDEVKARIFEPFFTTKELGRGTGLGLATVYAIVDRLGGGLDVHDDDGARFEIYLPAFVGTASPRPSTCTTLPPATAKTVTVLLVDDEVVLARSLAKGLRNEGYEVLVAHDAAEGRRLVREHGASLDLLLTDVTMPGDSGLDLAADALALVPALRVLVMSGHTDRVLPPELPAASFVQKPFSRATLLERIRDALED
ncbi:MAG: PAS domain S-box protein [Nannocystaceae bacterium]